MQFKVISLNLWLGGTLFDNILGFLKKENADILLLQEVTNGRNPALKRQSRSFDVLKNELNYKFGAFVPAFFENIGKEKIDWGNAVLSKFPVLKSKTIFFDIPYGERKIRIPDASTFAPRNLQKLILEVQNTKVNVFNTQGVWGRHGRDSEGRLHMSKIIVEEVKGEKNVVLAGDFNVNPDTETINNIEKYLKNVFKNELTSSFNMKRKKDQKFSRAVVDMIFVSRDLKIIEHYCPQVDVSDHLPLVCVCQVNQSL